jgi:penicillin-binding protein 2
MMATVANGGSRLVPRIVKAIDAGEGWQTAPQPPSPFPPVLLKPETVSAVRDGLWLAVNGAGTAGRARIAGRDVSGKTGTAQVISNEGKERARGKTDRNLNDHGWFVFMAPKDNPEVAGAIFVEHAEHGYFGATVAKHILETYFAQRDGLPLPTIAPPPPPAPRPQRTVAATAGAAGGLH